MPDDRKRPPPRSSGLTPVSDILPGVFKPPTLAQGKLIEASVLIRQEPDAVERAYLARELVQCTLPHSNPGNVEQWARRNGNLTLGISPGRDYEKNCTIGYPYGSIPRLLLFWINTEAVRVKARGTRRLELGDRLSDFMREIGLNPSHGGKRGDAVRLREQMRRLFSARISFQQTIQQDGRRGERRLNMEVAPQSELWWDPKRPEQATLWNSWVELGENFFHAITAAPVPSDMRALRALKRSPLALDLYVWATHKAMSVSAKEQPQFVPWTGLLAQFGADYGTAKNFRPKAIAALKKIQQVYPELKLQDAEGGITVLATSRPAIPIYFSR